MNFDFSDDLKQLRDQARRFLTEQSPPKIVRQVLEGDESYAATLWQAMAEMGWLGAAIPEQYGGAGLGYEGLCVLAEELGRAVAPVPFASSAYLATEALLLAGSDAQKRRLLPKLADGSAIGCFALAEGTGNPDPASVRMRAVGGRLSGSKWPVMDGGVADFAIVVARDESGRDRAVPGRSHRRHREPKRRSPPSIPAAITRASISPERGRETWLADRLAAGATSARAGGDPGRVRAGGRRRCGTGDGAELRLGALCIRPADRFIPGDQAQACRRVCRERTGAVECVLRRLGACRRMRPSCRWRRRPRGCRRPRHSILRRRRTSRRMAASASPGTWTATCIIGAPSSLLWRSGGAPWWKHRLVELIEMRNAA